MAHVTTPRWLSPVSRRIVVIVIAAAAALMLLTSLLVSNATAAETVRIIENTEGDACQALGYGVDAEEFVIPASGGRYNKTFDLGAGVSVSLTSPSNRKFVDFKIANATVNGAILFNRVDQDQGTWYDYDPAVSEGRLEPPPRDSGNDKKVVLCFDVRTEVSIDKVTTFGLGLEADSTSDYIPEGTAITFEYRVSIPTGGPAEALTNVAVTDDQGVVPVYVSGDTGIVGLLEYGETWIYRVDAIATEGAYTNTGSVNADGAASGQAVSDSDSSGYFGASAAIGIDKTTSGYDLDVAAPDPSGSYVGPGDDIFIGAEDGVLWTYTVTNEGNVPLSNVTVTDDQGVTPVYVSGDTDIDDLLEDGETWIYEATGVAEKSIIGGGYTNIGTASATAPVNAGTVSDATDDSGYYGFVATFKVVVELIVGEDTYDPTTDPFPVIIAGQSITWKFTATNTGNVPVTAMIVTESETEPTPICEPFDIKPGESDFCDHLVTAGDGESTPSFKVVGLDPNDNEVTETIENVGYFGGLDCGETVRSLTGDKVVDDGPDVWFYVGPVSDPELECGTAVEVTASLTSISQVASIVPAGDYPFIGTGIATITWDAIPRDTDPLVRTRQSDAANAVIEQCAEVIPIVQTGGVFGLTNPNALYPDAVDFDENGTIDGDICLIQQFNYQVDVSGEVYMQLQEIYYVWNDPILNRPK